MWGYVIIIALFALGFTAQFLLMRKTRGIWWRLSPVFVIAVLAVYGLLRTFGILRYPYDGGGFIDAGPFIGLMFLISLVPLSGGCLMGFITDKLLVFINQEKANKKTKKKKVKNKRG